MDSSSDFGPVDRGFMVFHFCRILGAFEKMQKICFQMVLKSFLSTIGEQK